MPVEAESDAENCRIVDEQTQLLGDNQSDQHPDQREPLRRLLSRYGWRILWAILVILLLVIFVKGWIDAGSDVDVGTTVLGLGTSSLWAANHA
jgi:hypothetical protein